MCSTILHQSVSVLRLRFQSASWIRLQSSALIKKCFNMKKLHLTCNISVKTVSKINKYWYHHQVPMNLIWYHIKTIFHFDCKWRENSARWNHSQRPVELLKTLIVIHPIFLWESFEKLFHQNAACSEFFRWNLLLIFRL